MGKNARIGFKDEEGCMNLLEKAKQVKLTRNSRRPVTQEQIDLVLAWCRDEVTLRQVEEAVGLSHTSVYAWVAVRLKSHLNKIK
jgi:hypothetical protein